MTFEIIPAIDVRGGRCVRLVQGDYARETVFDEDPVAVALRWQGEGATRLHVVDLDGAKSGQPAQRAIVERLIAAVSIPVQVGGGIRATDDVSTLLGAGAARVVLGTVALKERRIVEQAVQAFGPKRIVVALDARAGRIATEGWLEQSDVSAVDLALELKRLGLERVLYTDIARDGTLEGPNVAALADMVERTGLAVIASGGVTRAEDVRAVREAGTEAVIIGRALYSGAVTLAEAQSAALEGGLPESC